MRHCDKSKTFCWIEVSHEVNIGDRGRFISRNRAEQTQMKNPSSFQPVLMGTQGHENLITIHTEHFAIDDEGVQGGVISECVF